MSDFQNKVITIASKEEKKTKAGNNTKIYVTDQDGVKYSFFKKKKDGDLCAAAQQLRDMGLDEGSITQISWVAETYQYEGKDITENKVTSFRETSEQPVKGKTPAPRPQPAKAPNTYHKEETQGVEFWNKKAYKQCLWNYWLENEQEFKGRNFPALTPEDKDLVWEVFNQIEKDAEKRFSHGMERARLALGQDEAPLPEPVGEINVDDIGF